MYKRQGCICCSLVGDFGASLKEVIGTYHPDRIIIEPSGVGKLSDVIRAVEDVKEDCDLELNSFTTVADVTKCKMYLRNFGEFFKNQLEYANTIILSRMDKASQEKTDKAVELIREINRDASLITTPVSYTHLARKRMMRRGETWYNDAEGSVMKENVDESYFLYYGKERIRKGQDIQLSLIHI